MQGHIIRFDANLGQGIISSDEGQRYRFQCGQIRNPKGKLVGLDVDFLVESRRAQDIILLDGSPWQAFG